MPTLFDLALQSRNIKVAHKDYENNVSKLNCSSVLKMIGLAVH